MNSAPTAAQLQYIHVLVSIAVLVIVVVIRSSSFSTALDAPALSAVFGTCAQGCLSSSFNLSLVPVTYGGTWIPDLTTQGIEPNPGPSHRAKHSVEEIVAVRNRLRPKAPPLGPMSRQPGPRQIVVTNAPPISRISAPRNKSRKSTYASGDPWNPRAEMIGYFQTLCDPERFPPVRLGGETMVPTGLTTLHSVSSFAASSTSVSIVVIPRVWNPLMFSQTGSAPYNYVSAGGFNASEVTTLQTLANSARVVSCKVKVYSTSSATSDNGALTVGLSPADRGFFGGSASFVSQELAPNFAATALSANSNQISLGGYPITTVLAGSADPTNLSTQGFNEFPSEDWTDTVPLKTGASIFWLPQDPNSMIFLPDRLRQTVVAQINAAGAPAGQPLNKSEIYDPFFVIGLSGLTATTSTFNVEVFLNLEYTVTSGANNVIETRPGCMNSIEQFSVAKKIGGNLQNYVEPDPEASLTDKLVGVGKSVLRSGVNRISEFVFGSSDVGKAITSLFS